MRMLRLRRRFGRNMKLHGVWRANQVFVAKELVNRLDATNNRCEIESGIDTAAHKPLAIDLFHRVIRRKRWANDRHRLDQLAFRCTRKNLLSNPSHLGLFLIRVSHHKQFKQSICH